MIVSVESIHYFEWEIRSCILHFRPSAAWAWEVWGLQSTWKPMGSSTNFGLTEVNPKLVERVRLILAQRQGAKTHVMPRKK